MKLPLQNNTVIKILIATAALLGILALTVKGHDLTSLFHFKNNPLPVVNVTDANQFRTRNLLKGVFLSDRLRLALINNKYYHVGDIVDGLELVDITSKIVIFRDKTQTIALDVPV